MRGQSGESEVQPDEELCGNDGDTDDGVQLLQELEAV